MEAPSCPLYVAEQHGRGLGRDDNRGGGELLSWTQESPSPVGTRSKAVLMDDGTSCP